MGTERGGTSMFDVRCSMFDVHPMKPMLLIVEDEKASREGLRAALEDRFDVYVAEDATAATLLLEQEKFDVMLTDFQLPKAFFKKSCKSIRSCLS